MTADPHDVVAPITAALDELSAAVGGSTALGLTAERRATLADALARARGKLVLPAEPVLVVALAGGSGAGKSSMINALAGRPIAQVSPKRPCTSKATVYLHRAADAALLPAALTADATLVRHDRDDMRRLAVVDTPDLDSFVTEHRAYTTALLKGADVVLYVFSAESYEDERTWSVLQAERRFTASAAVLNKTDLLSEGELSAVRADLRDSLARVGLGEAPLFCTSTLAGGDAPDGSAPAALNELPRLAAWLIEHWRDKRIADVRTRQAHATLEHLRASLADVLPEDLDRRLSDARASLDAAADGWGDDAVALLGPRLDRVQQALWPAAMMAIHDRLSGPFRAYLAVVDFVRFGLPLAIARILGRPADTLADALRTQLVPLPSGLGDLLARARSGVGQALFKAGLPLPAWQAGEPAAADPAPELADDLARGLQSRWLGGAAPRGADRLLSFAGTVVPTIVILWSAWLLARDLWHGPELRGWSILGHAVASCVVWWLILHGAMLLTDRSPRRLAAAFVPTVRSLCGEWIASRLARDLERYGQAVRAEAERLTGPLRRIEAQLRSLGVAETSRD